MHDPIRVFQQYHTLFLSRSSLRFDLGLARAFRLSYKNYPQPSKTTRSDHASRGL
jgi:hypothetical protein